MRPPSRRLEIRQELCVLLRGLEVSSVQDEPARARFPEELDIGVAQLGAGKTEDQLLADERFEVDHTTIIGCRPPDILDLRCATNCQTADTET